MRTDGDWLKRKARYTMQHEIELKLRLDDLKELESKLQLIAKFVEKGRRQDIYFVPGSDLTTKSHRFRLRIFDDHAVVTYKEQSRVEQGVTNPRLRFQICEETEFSVDNPKAFVRFVRALGFVPTDSYGKYRTIYEVGRLTVELNDVEGVGKFIEIEALCESSEVESAKEEITQFVQSLTIPVENIETRWYTELRQG